MILAHDVAGSGPALLLVHAGIADRRMWDGQVGPFAGAGWTVWDRSEGALERGDHEEAARTEIDTWVVGMDRGPEAVDPEVRRRVREMLLAAYAHGEADLEEPDPPAATRLGEVAVPTLVVVGEHDRPDIHAMAAALTGGIAGAEQVILPGTGHLPNLERPAAFNQAVLEFLDRVG